MDRLKRVFEIFNVLWNASIQDDTSPQGLWDSIPEWARAYLFEIFSDVPAIKEGDPKFVPERPNLKYHRVQCYADDNDCSVVVLWDSEAAPPLLGVTLDLDAEFVITHLLPTSEQKKGLAPPPTIPMRKVAD